MCTLRRVRSTCVECGGYLTGRAERQTRPGVATWGSWCPRCCGWWPDDETGQRANTDQPPAWRLTDDPLTITAVTREGPAP